MQLHEWQQHFQEVVIAIAPVDALPLQEQGLSRALSMEIYANAYRERLHSALRDNYPALHQVLGDNDFADMAYAFTAMHPPRAASIRWFGNELANYLSITAPYTQCLALSDIARFEWALRHTVDAADATRVDTNYLQTLSAEQWETFRCALHPSLTILHCAWNAPQIWRALDAGEEPPSPVPFDSYWFIYRDADLTAQWRSADAYEAEALRLWAQDKNFADVCEFLAEKIGDGPGASENESAMVTAASFMRTWIMQGLLVYPNDKVCVGEK